MTSQQDAEDRVITPPPGPASSPGTGAQGNIIPVPVAAVVVREDLYPRIEHDEKMVRSYEDALDDLPPIIVNQDCILIDGYHRLAAHKNAGRDTIAAVILHTKTEDEILLHSISLNSRHGMQLTTREKQKHARTLVSRMATEDLARILGVNVRTVNRWTHDEREAQEEDRNNAIYRMYLNALTTQQQIAEKFCVDQATVSRVISGMREGQLSGVHTQFIPYPTTVWPAGVPGPAELTLIAVENLLYYHTERMDVVYDPFAGSTNTIPACRRWSRRYVCCDANVPEELKEDVLEQPFTDSLPQGTPAIQLMYIDLLCAGAFNDPPDLHESIACFLVDKINGVPRIAVHIAPYRDDEDCLCDDTSKYYEFMKRKGYGLEAVYVIQYTGRNPEETDETKETKPVCNLSHSSLIVWTKQVKKEVAGKG
jgi:hypothetical protein